MLRPRRLEQEESGHPKLGHYVATDTVVRKSQGDTLAESLHRLQADTTIPRQRVEPFPYDICTSNPYIPQLCSKETSTDLPGNDFCFWKLGHNSTRLREGRRNALRHEDEGKARRHWSEKNGL